MPAQFTKHFIQDLQQDIKIRQCGTIVFNADNLSNVITVDLYNGTEPYSGGGTVAGAVICPDGATVALTGTLSGNTASVTLTGDCFAIPGQIGVGVQVVSGSTRTTVLKAIYNVELVSTDDVVDPDSRLTASVAQLVSDIETATADIPASDMASLMSGIAPVFSATTNYAAGAYVYYSGTLYRFTNAHAAGSWTGTDATAVALGNDVADLKSAFDSVTEVLNYFRIDDQTINGKTIINGTYEKNGETFSGIKVVAEAKTSGGDSNFEIGTLPAGTYTAKFEMINGTAKNNVSLRYGSGSGTRWLNNSNNNITLSFAEPTRVFLQVTQGTAISGDDNYFVQYQISKGNTAGDFSPDPLSAVDRIARGKLIEVDDTLTVSGDAADAKTTGDEINDLISITNGVTELSNYFSIEDQTVNGISIVNVENGIKINRVETSASDALFELGTLDAGTYTAKLTKVSGNLPVSTGVSLRYGSGSGTKWYSFGIDPAQDEPKTFSADTRIILRVTSGTAPEDFIMQCQISKGNNADVYFPTPTLTAVDAIARGNISIVADDVSKINQNRDIMPHYWETAITEKIHDIFPYYMDAYPNVDAFIFLTDYHYDSERPLVSNNGWSPILVKRLMNDLPIDMFVFGGDAINGNASKTVALNQMHDMSSRFHDVDMYGIRGNHDYNCNDGGSAEVKISNSEFYYLFIKNVEDKITLASSYDGLDYYYDNTSQKIRYIFMDTRNEASTSEGGIITATQIEWMQNRITELASDWSVIIFAHQYFAAYASLPLNPTPGDTSMYRQQHKLFDGINAILNTASCTIIGIITGHIHADYSYNGNGFLEIATTTDSVQIGNTTINPGYAVGTAGEQAFDVFVLDKTNRKLKAFRIGHGQNREWTY